MKTSCFTTFAFVAALSLAAASGVFAADAIQPLRVQGEDFVDASGEAVKFWGVNLVALYPPHEVADRMAANLASLQVNLVRPHHMLRASSDWVSKAAPIVALQSYQNDTTRQPDREAWDRFDYLNAVLRKNGIYLMLSVWWTRKYQPGDVDVLESSEADRAAWMAAIEELNSWDWRKGFDVRKMLCVVDERVGALEEEFARQLLTHTNPYTKLTYAQDPQVLTLELINEFSTEYTIICGNKLPEYFQKKLLAKWDAFARAAGIEPGDLYKPADAKVRAVRAQFFRKLDEDYLLRMKAVAKSTGSKAAITFSNLWRGEIPQKMHGEHADYIEDHMYFDPMVAGKADDLILRLNKTPIAGKPFIVGELNHGEGQKNLEQQAPVRSALPLAVSAYGSLHNWSGITFFSWVHGDKDLGEDGWASAEGRESALGNMISDGMLIDHLRTCGIMFRRAMVQESTSPITLRVDEPLAVGDYNGLVRGKYSITPGWQNAHAVRKSYGPMPAGEANARWTGDAPGNPIVSDTRQITKDTARRQLTVVAPQTEAFTGYLDGKTPAGLKHLGIAGEGFATVVMVADDGAAIPGSGRLIISRTNVGADKAEVDGPAIVLSGLQVPAGKSWQMRISRPRQSDGSGSLTQTNGQLVLPGGGWHECELELK